MLVLAPSTVQEAVDLTYKAFDYADNNHERNGIILALRIFADKSGPYGLLGGQAVDVLFTGHNPDKERLDYIYRLKTCALIEGSMMIGAALAGADKSIIERFEELGRKVGLAFQIQDDILDCIGNEQTLGKPLNSDAKNSKTTYVTLFGVEKAKEEVESLSGEALRILDTTEYKSKEEYNFLRRLIESLVGREY